MRDHRCRGERHQRGEGADVAGAEDEVGRADAAGDEADVVGRADRADLERGPALRLGAERDQRHLQAVADDQEEEAEEQRGDRASVDLMRNAGGRRIRLPTAGQALRERAGSSCDRPSAAKTAVTMPAASSPAAAIHRFRLVLLDEAVGHGERPHLEAAVERAGAGEIVRARAQPKPPTAPSSTVISTSWSRDQAVDQRGVERLGEARVGDRRRQPVGVEFLRRLQRIRQAARRKTGSRPCRPRAAMRPRPISSGTPTSGISTPTPSPRG